jgi:hypothetical protein
VLPVAQSGPQPPGVELAEFVLKVSRRRRRRSASRRWSWSGCRRAEDRLVYGSDRRSGTLVDMVQPGPDPDNYPPIDPSEPVPDDPGELSPDTPETLPPAPVEPMPGPDDPGSVPNGDPGNVPEPA